MINKFSLAGDRFTNSPQKAYKNKERIQKFKEIGASIYIYLNELDEACVQHDMAYEAIRIFLEEQFLTKY